MTKEQQKRVGIGTVKKRDILENQAKIVYLGIGSNLGDRKKNIEIAKIHAKKSGLKIDYFNKSP